METRYTGKDHMAAVFGNGKTDRIAVRAMQGFRPIMSRAGVSGKEVATQPDKYVKALATLYEVSPSDAMAILVGDPALLADLSGLSFKEFRELGPGHVLLGDKSVLDNLEVRDVASYQTINYYTQICKLALEAMPDAVLDAVTMSPWSTAMKIRGMENCIYDTVDDPDFLHAVLRHTTDLTKMVGGAMLDAGVEMLTMGDPSAGCSVISPKMFRAWVQPYLQEAVAHFKSRSDTPIFLHICGFIDPILEDLLALGIDGLSIDAPSSLEKAVALSQGKVIIEGNFPGELYIEGSRDQIEQKVKESIEIAAAPNDYRYILCSGCQVPDTAPMENVQIFMEAGRQFGKHS